MLFEKIFDNYLNLVKIEKKEQTYFCYKSHLKNINKCLKELRIYDSDNIDNSFYLKFISYFKNKNCCNRTINKRIILFKSACLNSNIIFDFFTKKHLKENLKRFNIISNNDLSKIINYIYNLPNDNINLTNKLVILLLIDTGVRSNELINIKKSNISFENNSILLTTTKTDVQRLVFLIN